MAVMYSVPLDGIAEEGKTGCIFRKMLDDDMIGLLIFNCDERE
jgi:hypothetical protein